jgi:hypothetical protein
MGFNYTLKYRTFDQLLDDVRVDFQNLSLQNMIEPQQLIKVVKRVSNDLGLRIFMTKEALLEVHKGRVKLPDNFYVLNYAMVCDDVTIQEPLIQGTNIQEVPMIPTYKQTSSVIDVCAAPNVNCQSCGIPTNTCGCQVNPSNCAILPESQQYCTKPKLQMNCKGDTYELVQVVKSQQRTYKRLWPLQLLTNDQTIDCGCPNLYIKTREQAWIRDNYFYTNFDDAKIYISYQGTLEDDEGNLLVVDHDQINEYYEYAVKERILENLLMNDENVSAKLQLVQQKLRIARNYAKSYVNTPNFAEMKQLWQANRKAQYGKYYDQFKSYSMYSDFSPNASDYQRDGNRHV